MQLEHRRAAKQKSVQSRYPRQLGLAIEMMPFTDGQVKLSLSSITFNPEPPRPLNTFSQRQQKKADVSLEHNVKEG
jgi:hypothetical protein